MEATHKELRKLRMPHGVHKSTKNYTPSRNSAFQACQACYARKKRCVTSPSHHQCTYCFREGQRCLPRERPVRPVQKYKPEIPSEPPTRPKFDLPLPQGIDHEVPRWSAVYSMFSEALRLLPQEGLHMNDRRRRDSVEREQGPDRNTSCSPSNYLSDPDTRNGDVQLNSHEPEITTQETDESVPSPDALSSMKATTTPWEEPISIHPRHAGAGMFFGELDALLRF